MSVCDVIIDMSGATVIQKGRRTLAIVQQIGGEPALLHNVVHNLKSLFEGQTPSKIKAGFKPQFCQEGDSLLICAETGFKPVLRVSNVSINDLVKLLDVFTGAKPRRAPRPYAARKLGSQ